MRPELALKYDLRVPRYTSYPTAPHFSQAVNGETYAEWLRAVPTDARLSVYLHIPFCAKMCWFCGCNTRIVNHYEPIGKYLDLLEREIDLVGQHLPEDVAASHIHWGGGSPTALTAGDFLRLMDRLRARFPLTADAEVAVEMDPRTATRDYVDALARAGVTRASIGVQDFAPEVQKAINRIQPYDLTKRVVDWLREAGVQRLNIDLLYGLPKQTTEGILNTVDLAVTCSPQRVALFGYAHVPWMKKHQALINEADLPDTAARWEQADAAARRLVEHGYVRIGLDHFARPDDDMAVALAAGRLHRNFQGYTTDDAPFLIGLGASAIGALPQGYVQNETGVVEYRKAVSAGRLPVAKGITLSDDDRLRRSVIERLMCDLGVDLGALCRSQGADEGALDDALPKLTPLVADGFLAIDGRRLTVPEEGRPLVRAVCAAFDSYLVSGEQRHSRAV